MTYLRVSKIVMPDYGCDETTEDIVKICKGLGNFSCTDVFWPNSFVNGLSARLTSILMKHTFPSR